MEWSLTGLPLPIVLRPPSPLTDDELMAFSRKNKPYRIESDVSGQLHIYEPLAFKTAQRKLWVVNTLGRWADEASGIVLSGNAGFRVRDGAILTTDAPWICADRWTTLSRSKRDGFLNGAPDFLIEVRSEDVSTEELHRRMQLWIANGAQLAWMVDPYGETITIYRPGALPEILQTPDFIEAGAPVAGFRLTTSRLWEKGSSEPDSKP
jgi:Uma2 family endonuclease